MLIFENYQPILCPESFFILAFFSNPLKLLSGGKFLPSLAENYQPIFICPEMSCLKPSWYRLLFSVTFLPHNHCDLWRGQHGRSIVLICIDRHKNVSPLYTTLLVHMLPLKYKYTNTNTETTYFLWTEQLFLPTVAVFMYQKVRRQITDFKKADHSNNFNFSKIWLLVAYQANPFLLF